MRDAPRVGTGWLDWGAPEIGGNSVTVQATSDNTVSATADIFSIGIIAAGAGAAAIAEVDGGAGTEALVGTASSISAASAVQILATADEPLARGDGTILVVEDNPEVASVSTALLTQLGFPFRKVSVHQAQTTEAKAAS